MRGIPTTLFLLFWTLPVFAQDHLAQLVTRVGPSVVSITTRDECYNKMATGTGFFIDQAGTIATSMHVLKHASYATAVTKDGEELTIEGTLGADQENDVVLLRARAGSSRITPVQISSQIPSPGSRIFVVGYPLGLSESVSDGIVSAVHLDGDEKTIQVTAPISPGSSGSPVFNWEGQAIGIAKGSFVDGQNINLAAATGSLSRIKRSFEPFLSVGKLWPVKTNGKWGYVNRNGQVVIEPRFSSAHPFRGGLARVSFDPPRGGTMAGVRLPDIYGPYGFIDDTGTLIVEAIYSDVGDFTGGLAVVHGYNEWFFVDETGKEIRAPWMAQWEPNPVWARYSPRSADVECTVFGGVAQLRNSNREVRLISLSESVAGKTVLRGRDYTQVSLTPAGIIMSLEGYKRQYFDYSGNQMSETVFLEKDRWWDDPFVPDCLNFGLESAKPNNCRFRSRDYPPSELTPRKYDYAGYFHEQRAVVVENGKWGFIAPDGSYVVRPSFDYARGYDGGLAVVYVGVNPIFDEDWAGHLPAAKIGYVDWDGKMVWRPTK